eukprot:scaffold91586_cov20-Tisochrysis_lutea.AAC.2
MVFHAITGKEKRAETVPWTAQSAWTIHTSVLEMAQRDHSHFSPGNGTERPFNPGNGTERPFTLQSWEWHREWVNLCTPESWDGTECACVAASFSHSQVRVVLGSQPISIPLWSEAQCGRTNLK